MDEARAKQAEGRLRALLEDGGLPAPDEVVHDEEADELVLLWHDRQVAVVVALGEDDRGGRAEVRAVPLWAASRTG